jgi:hypothetical protein
MIYFNNASTAESKVVTPAGYCCKNYGVDFQVWLRWRHRAGVRIGHPWVGDVEKIAGTGGKWECALLSAASGGSALTSDAPGDVH